MMEESLIYVIEDEPDLCQLICRKLREYHLQARGFHTGTSARQAIARQLPAACIIDLMLPDIDGMELVRELSANPRVGVIVLTARGDVSDRVLGLEIGADDYLVKPFEPRELVARVRSLLRRMESLSRSFPVHQASIATFAGRSFDTTCLTVRWQDGRAETLSASEALLLTRLLRSPKRVLSRDQLLGDEPDLDWQPFDRSIDIRISRIRRKIETDPKNPQIIKTVYGAGYLLAADVEWRGV